MNASEGVPWLSDPGVLLPLQSKYEEQIYSLQASVEEARVSVLQLRAKLSQKTEENTKLQAEINSVSLELLELKGVLPGANESNTGANLSNAGNVSLSNAHLTATLQQQIRLLTEEKDNALELATSANTELDILQKEYKEKAAEIEVERTTLKAQYEQGANVANSYMTLRARNAELEKLNSKLQENVEELTNKVATFTDYFKQSQEEHKTSSNQLMQLKTSQQQLEQVLQKKTMEAKRASEGERNMESQLDELHKAIESLDNKYREASSQSNRHNTEKRQLMDEIDQLRKDKDVLEMREADAVKEVRQATQLVENAILEKDQAVAREGQKNEEIEKLRDELNKVYEQAGEKTRREVEAVRVLCNKSVDRLMEDIHSLEMKVAEKQSEVERVFREKKLVENELEKALRDQVTGGQEVEQLQDRSIRAERLAEDTQLKLKNLQQHVESVQAHSDAQISNLEGQLRDAKQRNNKLASDMQLNSEKCLQLQEQVEYSKKQAMASEQAKQLANRKAAKSVASAEQDLELRVTEYEARIESMEECHHHAIQELQRMLIQQQQLGAKWREQSNTLQQKCENAMLEMKEDLTVHKKRVDELNELLAETKRKKAEMEKQYCKMQSEKSRTHEQMLEAQRQLSLCQDQLAQVVKRERQLTNDNLRISNEMDQLRINNTLNNAYVSDKLKESALTLS
ncbi:sodium channel and clathrin linker 1-like [Convolutriloba macropyga]|uniref:sodium channel and clathrin linker 1-like n=1 Tax=Convolutriloba macropyga TaxID=536237 RepID=UPI003F51AD8F